MGKPTGFIEFNRETEPYRDPAVRMVDFKEIYTPHNQAHLEQQGFGVTAEALAPALRQAGKQLRSPPREESR